MLVIVRSPHPAANTDIVFALPSYRQGGKLLELQKQFVLFAERTECERYQLFSAPRVKYPQSDRCWHKTWQLRRDGMKQKPWGGEMSNYECGACRRQSRV